MRTIPCRVEDIRRTDARFVPLLREYNRQRVNTLAEVMREEVISADPEEAHRMLIEHRREQSQIETPGGAIEIEGYRDLLQSQPNQIEIVGEKNTIANIVRPVAMEYCIPFTIGRGYSSLPPRQKMMKRFRTSGKEKLILVVLSDFDPEGEDIAHSFARSMRDDFGVSNIAPVKVALTRDQINRLNLPPQMTAKGEA